MKKRKYILGCAAMLIPLIASFAAVKGHSWIGCLASVGMIFVLVAIIPFCCRYESLWVFLLTAVDLIPVTAYMSYKLVGDINGGWGYLLLGILYFIEYYFILLSVEEVVLGFIARVIWKRQNKFIK